MARLFGLSKEWVARIHPLFPKERGVSGSMTERCCAASSMGPKEICTGWMPRRPLAPTKPSTTVAAAGQVGVF